MNPKKHCLGAELEMEIPADAILINTFKNQQTIVSDVVFGIFSRLFANLTTVDKANLKTNIISFGQNVNCGLNILRYGPNDWLIRHHSNHYQKMVIIFFKALLNIH